MQSVAIMAIKMYRKLYLSDLQRVVPMLPNPAPWHDRGGTYPTARAGFPLQRDPAGIVSPFITSVSAPMCAPSSTVAP